MFHELSNSIIILLILIKSFVALVSKVLMRSGYEYSDFWYSDWLYLILNPERF